MSEYIQVGRTIDGSRLIPGYNVDKVDTGAGLEMLVSCGFTDPKTIMVIEYALARHARGEEPQALRAAIDRNFHGIPLTAWYMVLAAALAGAEGGAR